MGCYGKTGSGELFRYSAQAGLLLIFEGKEGTKCQERHFRQRPEQGQDSKI